jgi:hypothetical protein
MAKTYVAYSRFDKVKYKWALVARELQLGDLSTNLGRDDGYKEHHDTTDAMDRLT